MAPIDDPRDAALVVLARFIHLMGAELLTGAHHDNLARFEAAVRRQFAAVMAEGFHPEMADADFTLARTLVEATLLQIRSQWLAARATDEEADVSPWDSN